LRGAERRSVRELQLLEIPHRQLGAERGREDVEALVDAVEPGDLGAEDAAGVWREQQLDVHHRGAGVVAGMP
jgi:hypothetical protein